MKHYSIYQIFLIIIGVSVLSSCNMKDEDRCPSGTTYFERGKTCVKDEIFSTYFDTQGTTDSINETDTGSEVQDAGASDDTITGLGIPCETSDQCTEFTADQCLFNPITNTGYCSIIQCSDKTPCPKNYTCCDCAEAEVLPAIIVCMNQDDALMATQYNECTCAE